VHGQAHRKLVGLSTLLLQVVVAVLCWAVVVRVDCLLASCLLLLEHHLLQLSVVAVLV
jgi:hypothetical protein